MHYSFTASGHPNILATHPTTLEITKHPRVTKKGDCIIAVKADFSLEKIKNIIHNKKNLILKLKIGDIIEQITAEINPDFNDSHDLILRKTNFLSERTLGIRASKSSLELNRDFIKKLQHSKTKVIITLETTN